MTDDRKHEDQTPENKLKATDELKDGELDKVSGGSFDLSNIVGGVAKAVLPIAK